MSPDKFIFYLEVALLDPADSNVYAFENVSHIPTTKLVEIFSIDLVNDPEILEGYFLTKDSYNLHKYYLEKEIGAMNFDVFEYCLRLYATNEEGTRRLYKESLIE